MKIDVHNDEDIMFLMEHGLYPVSLLDQNMYDAIRSGPFNVFSYEGMREILEKFPQYENELFASNTPFNDLILYDGDKVAMEFHGFENEAARYEMLKSGELAYGWYVAIPNNQIFTVIDRVDWDAYKSQVEESGESFSEIVAYLRQKSEYNFPNFDQKLIHYIDSNVEDKEGEITLYRGESTKSTDSINEEAFP